MGRLPASRTARAGIVASAIALGLAVSGPLLAHLGIIAPLLGFGVLLVGTLTALVAAIALVVGIARDTTLLGRLGRWLVVDGVIVLAVMASAAAGRTVPRINDIATDTGRPLELIEAGKLAENTGRDLSYDASFAAIQREAYPDVTPIVAPWPPDESFRKALAIARELGWAVHANKPLERRFEATERSRLFRFVDDIAVRVNPLGEGSVVDVRSKSRDGKGDLGVNARRIRIFRSKLLGG